MLNCFLLLQVTALEYTMEAALKMVMWNVQGLYYPIKGMCILLAFKRGRTQPVLLEEMHLFLPAPSSSQKQRLHQFSTQFLMLFLWDS